uniref:nicotinate phosphoribosyltransferase n=1 Tax=Drosophila rhopaloa TaxID=1041015 RepID=A0A6P4FFF0_DRORH
MNDRELSCSAGGQFMDRGRMNQNGVVQPLLTDLYQITMAYAYWKSDKTDDTAVFDLFFRNNPFHGEFTIFAGLEECLKFLDSFHYSQSDIEYLKQTLPEGIEHEFFEYLGNLTARDVTLYAIDEGTVAFPRVPIIKIEGPLIIVQLLETTLLTLVNYASLMATNAARYRMVAGKHVKLLEFGLRRAQGPDGGLSASKYSYTGTEHHHKNELSHAPHSETWSSIKPINGQPRIKLSQDVEKVTMPGNKNAYRLYSADGHALIDLLQKVSEPPPAVSQKVLCRHPFQESKRAYVIPSHVESLYKVYWKSGKICQQLPTLEQVREKVQISLKTLRNDHKRTLNPTPYKVAVSDNLYNFIHDLWLQNAPIGELS